MASFTFQGVMDFLYWAFTGLFTIVQEGATKIAEMSDIPPWFLIIIVVVIMFIMLKQKLSTWMFWMILFIGLIMILGISGLLPIEELLMTTPTQLTGGVI